MGGSPTVAGVVKRNRPAVLDRDAAGGLVFDTITLFWLVLSAFGVGALIGAVGIGGVLLVPALIYLAGLGVQQSMATALASFIATGVAGTMAFQRRGSIHWQQIAPLSIGAVCFGFLGAVAASYIDARGLSVILALVIIFAGAYTLTSLRGMSEPALTDRPRLQMLLLFGIGGFAGFGAGLTGAGGPVLSVPAMIVFGFPPLQTIGASQVIQILAASSGTVGHLRYGNVDFVVLGIIVLFEVAGVFLGAKIVHTVNEGLVRRFVAWLCVVVGGGMMIKELWF